MWILKVILILVIVYFLKFFYDLFRQRAYIDKQGGMLIKYQKLIGLIQTSDPGFEIKRLTGSSVLLVLPTAGGMATLLLIQTFRELTIQWRIKSIVFGEHQLEWHFDENTDQEKIYNILKIEMLRYQSKMMNFGDLDKYLR